MRFTSAFCRKLKANLPESLSLVFHGRLFCSNWYGYVFSSWSQPGSGLLRGFPCHMIVIWYFMYLHTWHPSVPNKQECKFLCHCGVQSRDMFFAGECPPSFGGEFRTPCLFLNDLIASIYENRPGGSGCHQCLPQSAGVAEKIYCKLKWSPWAPHRWIRGVAEGIRLAKDWGVPIKVGRPRTLHLCITASPVFCGFTRDHLAPHLYNLIYPIYLEVSRCSIFLGPSRSQKNTC